LTFVTNNYKEGKKAKYLIESILSIDICEELESESTQLQRTSSNGTTKPTDYYLAQISAASMIRSEENTVDQGTQSP